MRIGAQVVPITYPVLAHVRLTWEEVLTYHALKDVASFGHTTVRSKKSKNAKKGKHESKEKSEAEEEAAMIHQLRNMRPVLTVTDLTVERTTPSEESKLDRPQYERTEKTLSFPEYIALIREINPASTYAQCRNAAKNEKSGGMGWYDLYQFFRTLDMDEMENETPPRSRSRTRSRSASLSGSRSRSRSRSPISE